MKDWSLQQLRDELLRLRYAIDEPNEAGDQEATLAACSELQRLLARLRPEHLPADLQKLVGAVYFDLSSTYRELELTADAEEAYAATIRVLTPLTQSPEYAQFALGQLAACQNHRGLLYLTLLEQGAETAAQAAEAFDTAIRMRDELSVKYPDDELNQIYLGGALCNRGHVARETGDREGARALYRRSIQTLQQAIPPCDCGCQEAIVSAISQAQGHPHWIMLGHQFRRNAEQGLAALDSPVTLRDTIMRAIPIMASIPPENEEQRGDALVRRLGISKLQAELIAGMVPLALGRALIARFELSAPIIFAEMVWFDNHETEQHWELRLDQIPEYVEAQQLADETYTTGAISRPQLEALLPGSPEFNAFNDILNEGLDPSGAVSAPTTFFGIAHLPEFEAWYQERSTQGRHTP